MYNSNNVGGTPQQNKSVSGMKDSNEDLNNATECSTKEMKRDKAYTMMPSFSFFFSAETKSGV